MRRPFAAALFLVALVPASAAAQVPSPGPFEPCGSGAFLLCGSVAVPLDRSGALPGSIRLKVRRLAPPGPASGAVFALAGGPGQAATPFTEYVAYLFRGGLRRREVVTFDQRGTGGSGLLRCPTLEGLSERVFQVAGAAADCAEHIGARRALFTTRESVEDLEAVRRAVGFERITLYGVSYGTKLALAYAAAYPEHVERMVLDSVVGLDEPDPFARESLAALPRVLRLLCGTSCRSFTADPVADVGELIRRLARGLLRGPVVRDDGRVRESRLGRVRLFDLLLAGDFDATLRAGLPAAMRSALNGDGAPILRLARRAERLVEEPISYFSPALYATTQCEEGPLPWSRTTPPAGRFAEARTRIAATPAGELGPFDLGTAFILSSPLQLCRLWPSAPAEPTLSKHPFPAVPALVVSGEDDVRTPVESASEVARLLPRGTLLTVPDTGHSALDGINAGCARRAARKFLSGRAPTRCKRRPRLVPLEPVAPTSLSQLEPARALGGRPGQTLTALRRTLEDAAGQFNSALFAFDLFRAGFPGLRGGLLKLKRYGFRLERFEYVPGVVVTGELRGEALSRGFVRVSGPAASPGRLRLRRGILVGRIGGRRARLAVPAELPGIRQEPTTVTLGAAPRRAPLVIGGQPFPGPAGRR
jgi:pimeloyl-ACP methyl ester carboxylesterase